MGGCAGTHILDALQVALQCFALSAFMRQLILRLGKLVGDLHIPTRHARKPGMKVMLLDSATAATVSLVCSQSQALEHQVYHVDKLGNPRARRLGGFRALVIVRPTPDKPRRQKPLHASMHVQRRGGVGHAHATRTLAPGASRAHARRASCARAP